MEDHGASEVELTEIRQLVEAGSLLTAASLSRTLMRPADFAEFIDSVFIAPNHAPHSIHNLVVDLGPTSFITTNYDRLIEKAFDKVHSGQVLRVVNNNQTVEQARIMKYGASQFVFTPHGRAEHSDTIILATEDYRSLRMWSATLETLRHLLISRPIVYIGFSLQDPDFLFLKDEIAETYQGGEREHFAIMPDVSDLQKRFWRDQYGINIVSYPTTEHKNESGGVSFGHDALLELLRELHSQIRDMRGSGGDFESVESPQNGPLPSIPSITRYCQQIVYREQFDDSFHLTLYADYRADLSPADPDSRNLNQFRDLARRASITNIFERVNNFALIGSPGSGKSHTVNSFATRLAQATLEAIQADEQLTSKELQHSLPIVIPMREYDGRFEDTLATRLPQHLGSVKALEAGFFTIICDAVNEVDREFVETGMMVEDLTSFMMQFPANRYIVTSRSWNYVSSLALPTFELAPVSSAALEEHLQDSAFSFTEPLPQIMELARNPFFLKLFLQFSQVDIEVTNAADLLKRYFADVEETLANDLALQDLSLVELLAFLAYEAVEEGTQTLSPEYVLSYLSSVLGELRVPERRIAQQVFDALVFRNVLVLDAEGEVSLFHQTAQEYLAALALKQRYEIDSSILEQKITHLRWDETIILFITLLSPVHAKEVLQRLAEVDLVFAGQAFELSASNDPTIGLQLFDIAVTRLSKENISSAEKQEIAAVLRSIGSYGHKTTLQRLLHEPYIGEAAALALARMNAQEMIPAITERLLEHNVWPSDFAHALMMLVDESSIPVLVEYGRQADEGLTDSNLALVLSALESEKLYSEIDELVTSAVLKDRVFAVEVLSEINSQQAQERLVKLISDPEPEVQWRVIFGLHHRDEPYKDEAIVNVLFKLLKHEENGHYAAEYLADLAERGIVEEAKSKLSRAISSTERINLSTVVAHSDPELAKATAFTALASFDGSRKGELRTAIIALGRDKVVPDILEFLSPSDFVTGELIFDVLHWLYMLDEKFSITNKQFATMFHVWECSSQQELMNGEQVLPRAETSVAKPFLLAKLSDPTYPERERLLPLVSRLPLNIGDLDVEIIEWIVGRISYSRFHREYPAADILGTVCSETVVREKIMPLLTSSHDDVRSAAREAVKRAERNLGVRLLL